MTKVLLIEDDPIQIMILGTKMKIEGILCIVARNGKEALIAATSEKPDIILSDILLGAENGLDIVEKIKKNKKTKDIPIIIFTNYADKKAMERAESIGVVEYIIKSGVTPKKIIEKIRGYN
ncbi:MAG: response regulator [Candidatus Paceibacterota bacterium]|jgi:CheY-like chemotaxis protein|nr:response regulator [bacterium]